MMKILYASFFSAIFMIGTAHAEPNSSEVVEAAVAVAMDPVVKELHADNLAILKALKQLHEDNLQIIAATKKSKEKKGAQHRRD
jgi:pheromone shutdown protein TraB